MAQTGYRTYGGWFGRPLAKLYSKIRALHSDRRRNQLGGKALCGQMTANQPADVRYRTAGIQEHQHRRPGSTQCRTQDAVFTLEFLQCRQERTERSTIGLMDAIIESGR